MAASELNRGAGQAVWPAVSLAIHELAWERGGRRLFEGLEVELLAGELMLVLGANGTGKSTLLRVLAALLRPAEGSLVWCGQPVDAAAEYRAQLHFVTVANPLKAALSGRENLHFCQAMLGGAGALDEALAELGCAGFAFQPVRYLSTGQRRRIALARLLAAARPLWLLDEPEAGLDADGRATLTRLVERHRAAGGIVVAASHDAALWRPSATLDLAA